MNLEQLSVGMIVKNYKEMCELLGEKVKSGTSKKAQLKEWKRYFDWKHEGYKFIIKEIYNKPKPKIDNRGKSLGSRKNNTSFIDIIELLLLDLLAQDNSNRIINTRNQLLRKMNMANDNYIYSKKMIPKLAEYTNVNRAIVYDFYNTSDSNFRSTIERALKSLYDRRCIFYKKVIMVKRFDQFEHEVADHLEEEFIISCEREILEKMNFKKVSDVIAANRWEEYRKNVKKLLKEKEEYNIEYHYIAYDITLNKEGILKSYNSILDLLLQDVERKEKKDELNKNIIDRFLLNAKRRRERAKEKNKVVFGEKKEDYRDNDRYIEEIEKLLYILINPNAQNILNKVANTKITYDWEKGEISEEFARILEELD